MNKVRIVGAIASQTGVTLYLENGKEMSLKKDSYRTKAILDDAVAKLARNRIVTLDLDEFDAERRIEKKSKGFIRFIREKIGQLFHSGGTDTENAMAPQEGEVVVALVGDKRIEGVDALGRHIERAAYGEDFEGFKCFMERLAAVVDKRKHSVDELINFMRRGDLPIAQDGSIIGYKVLRSSGDHFVDGYSGRVKQKLGSHVSMPESLVDDSRRTECSTGLHIARRGYLRGFYGDVITIVKVAPEDVIAVPENEPDKMRAAAYHIVAIVPPEVHAILRENKPMTSNALASKILADVIAGNHVGIREYVRIHGPHGNNLEIIEVGDAGRPVKPLSSGTATALDDERSVVSIKQIRKTINEETQKVKADADARREARNARRREQRAAKAAEAVFEPKRKAKPGKPQKAAQSAPAATSVKPENELSINHQKALKLIDAGKSQRAIEAELNVCRKTIRKLVKTYRPSTKSE